ncbi:MAG: hypothetical protein ACOCYE_04405 [Pseudomonadota bacterium]
MLQAGIVPSVTATMLGAKSPTTRSTPFGMFVAFELGFERMTSAARDLLDFYRRLATMRVPGGLVRDAVLGPEAPGPCRAKG